MSGIFASICGALPLLSQLLPEKLDTFPPLGDIESAARVGLVVLAFAITFVLYFWAATFYVRSHAVLAVALVIAFISLLCFLGLHQRFVRRVDIPSKGTAVSVSVGYERTPFANTSLQSLSDWEMLRARGTDDEQILKLWTAKSLIVVRLLLLGTYALVVLALVGAFSLGVVADIYKRFDASRSGPEAGTSRDDKTAAESASGVHKT
jgi:hypothetical protein